MFHVVNDPKDREIAELRHEIAVLRKIIADLAQARQPVPAPDPVIVPLPALPPKTIHPGWWEQRTGWPLPPPTTCGVALN